ncbi:hypothetical protein BC829DRAFT_384863 [Chytridium lagenaria]|nr:hypothetical protein BC829DRAFT_384863 [Chytridium lagenaria]
MRVFSSQHCSMLMVKRENVGLQSPTLLCACCGGLLIMCWYGGLGFPVVERSADERHAGVDGRGGRHVGVRGWLLKFGVFFCCVMCAVCWSGCCLGYICRAIRGDKLLAFHQHRPPALIDGHRLNIELQLCFVC